MDKISKIKTDLLMREWAEMVRTCRSNGLTVKEWCLNNGINIKTYYYRLKIVRDFICDNRLVNITDDCSSAHHDIVTVPMNPTLDNGTRQIKITSANIAVELPPNVQPQLLKAAINYTYNLVIICSIKSVVSSNVTDKFFR